MSQFSFFIAKFKRYAFTPPIVRRALIMAVVVGFFLIAINHGDRIFGGTFCTTSIYQSLLTILVPYAVSTLSSVMAIEERVAD